MFTPLRTTLADLRAREYVWGDEVIERSRGTGSYMAGMIDASQDYGVELVPLLSISYGAGPMIAGDAWHAALGDFLEAFRRAPVLDAICLALHGAAGAEDELDCEGALLSQLRAICGWGMPVACTLDIHASLTPAMLNGADGLFGSNVYPEIDSYHRGREAIGFLTAMVRGRLKPVKAHRYLPLMAQWDGQHTGEGPAKALVDLCREWESEPRMVDCGFFFGYTAANVPTQGTHVLVVTNADADLAERAAASVADEIWRRRRELVQIPPSPEEAVAMAAAHTGHPVILAEGSDNPGGGHYGDATSLLSAMLSRADEIRPAAFAAIRDPDTVAAAWQAGVGADFDARIGGKSPDAHSDPIESRVRVKLLTDGQYTMTFPRFRGTTGRLGRTALVSVRGIDVIVCEESRQIFDSGPFLLHGIDPVTQRVVGLKSAVHFRAHYKHFASRIILTVTPWRTKPYPFDHLAHPLWQPDTGD